MMSLDSGSLKTELTLGMPGGGLAAQTRLGVRSKKRGFNEIVDLNLGTSCENHDEGVSVATQPHDAKFQVVGWPPVRSYRENMMTKSCKYVKVAVDGAPYQRKVDLEIYTDYQHLLAALDDMFTTKCSSICNVTHERKTINPRKGREYVPTYEDKDGDWMLVGDVPWKMFVESCKRVRLMKSSEAIGLVSTTFSEDLKVKLST